MPKWCHFTTESIFDQVSILVRGSKMQYKINISKKIYQDFNWNVKSILLLDRINISN